MTLAFIILAPFCLILTSEGIKYAEYREQEHLSIRKNVFEDIASNESRVLASAEEWYDRNLSANIRLVTDSLKTFVTDEGYTGPEWLLDGFILTFDGERPVYPKDISEADTQISRTLVEESVASGAVRTGRLTIQPEQVGVSSPLEVTDGKQAAEPEAYLLSFGKIADSLYYVDLTAEADYRDYMAR